MSVLKFLFFTDPHIQNGCPPSRKGDYKEQVFAKLVDVGRMARENKCDFVLCGGDVFHYQSPEKNTYDVVNRTIDVFKGYGMPLYCLEGNHDLKNDRQDSIRSQPFGTLVRSGAISHLRQELVSKGDLSVLIKGHDFTEDPDYNKMTKPEVGCDLSVAVLHMYASPSGGDLFGTKIHSYEELLPLGYDIYMFGHFHRDQGVTYLGDKAFSNCGSLTRGDYGDNNLNRVPRVVLVTITKEDGVVRKTLEPLEVTVAQPGVECFDVVRQESIQKNREETAAFTEELKKVMALNEDESPQDISSEIKLLHESGVEPKTMVIVNMLIAQAHEELQVSRKRYKK